MPRAAAPGARFEDDDACMVLAAPIVEVVSGLRFDAFLHRRVFQPLGMADTGFVVPPTLRHRIVDVAATDESGKLAPEQDEVPGQRRHAYLSGADGLYSTAADYARFAQMLLDGGALDGVHVLGRKSAELMMRNHLSHLVNPTWDARASEGMAGWRRTARRCSRGPARQRRHVRPGGGVIDGVQHRSARAPRGGVMLQQLPHDGQAPQPIAELGNLVYQALAR